MFLRKLDEVKSKGRKQRARTYSEDKFAEEVNPPSNAPKWTITGYNGPLRRLVCSDDGNKEDTGSENERQKKKRKKGRNLPVKTCRGN